ncbi:MAG: 2-oxoacid:acceptor oxidoreductase subunit alpha [Atribacterota bacterium]|jgi:2-oxoglutarate ferredoxin oxidoreductase subunit alpha|nr:2-oxoacid:acceptor oxidoreductase subunit alpha [Atribacterota bacterium]MDD5497653.1 2-oxoacid:acceptor oxidoreductase subunit alpha [Atribacterota bacterium]
MKKVISQITLEQDISIVLCGEAGQGIQTVEQLLTRMLKLSGYYVFATKEYMSRVRGGSNSTQIRVSSKPIQAPVSRIDLLIPLDKEAINHVSSRLGERTIIIGDQEKLDTDKKVINVSFLKMAQEIGKAIYANIIAVGLLLGLLEGDIKAGRVFLKDYFTQKKKEEFVADNIKALERGYQEAKRLIEENLVQVGSFPHLKKSSKVENNLLLNGAEAIGLGAIAGGCNFISSYPMSPSTGVLVFLAQYAHDFNIIAEQAEDEISAINMAIGAWYAGARAMVTTSGGGFSLMTEGLSLAGMIESPLVIHLAQRPGPATGLPTRTEQGDLHLALYAGHGEFPRIILAPGNIEEAYQLMQKAFYWADQYQIPVFILTDQYTMDTYYNIERLSVPQEETVRFIIKTDYDYQRYKLGGKDGLSPRGIPGFGEGLVRVDSDEHDEMGLITEDMSIRNRMVEKRNAKWHQLKKEALIPTLTGTKDYRVLCVGWGSTYYIIKEALDRLDKPDMALLHFQQVYPISEASIDFLKRAKQIISIENNYSGQFSQLLEMQTGISIRSRILKYDGLPFYADELAEEIKDVIEENGGQK